MALIKFILFSLAFGLVIAAETPQTLSAKLLDNFTALEKSTQATLVQKFVDVIAKILALNANNNTTEIVNVINAFNSDVYQFLQDFVTQGVNGFQAIVKEITAEQSIFTNKDLEALLNKIIGQINEATTRDNNIPYPEIMAIFGNFNDFTTKLSAGAPFDIVKCLNLIKDAANKLFTDDVNKVFGDKYNSLIGAAGLINELTIATPKPEPKPTPKPETKPATKPGGDGICEKKHGFFNVFSDVACLAKEAAHAVVSVAGGIAQGVGNAADGLVNGVADVGTSIINHL